MLGTDGFVRLAVSCSHPRSGFRRTYTRKFKGMDIVTGEFERPGVATKASTSCRPVAETQVPALDGTQPFIK